MKRKWKIIIGIAILLTVLNPTNTDFDSYLRAKGFDESLHGGRTGYLFIFSIYEIDFHYGSGDSMERHAVYVGILNSFIKVYDTL
jgi:hypothetical protein